MQAKLHQQKEIVAAVKRLQKLELASAFDAVNPDSRPTAQQQLIFDDLVDIEWAPGVFIPKVQYRFVVAGNQSGKSSLAAREIAWIVTDTHPTWKRPARWGEEPLLILIAGQDRKQMEIELWEKKLKPFLDASDWRHVRVAGILNYVEHRKYGHKIVFLSHNDSSDSNRQHMQGYVAHYVWLDEMPRHISILEELQRRVDSRKGYLIATFTPKTRNEAIRRVVDAAREPVGRKYQLSRLDNPNLSPSEKDLAIQKLAGLSQAQQRTTLYGDWASGEQAVYQFDSESMVVDSLPEGYSKAWRHVVSVDPALKSKFGFTLFVECPYDGIWYLLRDDYLSGIYSPDDMVNHVQKLSAGYNVVKRICDPHESWFIGQAAKYRIQYESPHDKSNRKPELIKNLQVWLSSGKLKIGAWCANFIDEVSSCQFSENGDRIINSSSYHVLDASQYFIDLAPRYDEAQRIRPWHEELRLGNEQRKIREKQQQAARVRSTKWRNRGWR